jgi:aspartyl aminopeptidase
MNKALFSFIAESPTAFHAAAAAAKTLRSAGYLPLQEAESWSLAPGQGYYVTRNLSSLIAFRVPEGDFSGFMMAAAHGDSPAFRIKENALLSDEHYVRFSTEGYGGMLCASWMDRPLSVAGRVLVRTENGLETKLIDLKEPTALIPNVAIHFNRNANSGTAYNAAVDMLPLYGLAPKKDFRAQLAESAGVCADDLVTTDLIVYNPQPGIEWNGLISAPRLDDLQCAFAALRGFLDADKTENLPVYCLFDNEEVGSTTKQGANSDFLADALWRICEALGREFYTSVAASFMASADNAHAVHPNHSEHADRADRPVLNGGVVLKYNANRHYTTDSVSAALFSELCGRIGVPVQRYTNRADIRGGWTLGHVSLSHVSLDTADIGLPQLAMHSCYETAGAKDTQYLVRVVRELFSRTLRKTPEGFSLL